jgi:preprotein translocase subunit SecD
MGLRRSHLIGIIAAAAALCAVSAILVTIVIRRAVTKDSGATTMTVAAQAPTGGAPDSAAVERTRQLLLARLKAAGLDGASVTRKGSDRLVVKVSGHPSADRLRALAAPGELQMRPVLKTTTDRAGGANEANGTSPEPPSTPPLTNPTRDQVRAKLGAAYDVASRATDPDAVADNQLAAVYPFAYLTPAEVAVLPPEMQFVVPLIGCDKLRDRPAAPAGEPLAACDDKEKYLLDTAKVLAKDLKSAQAKVDEQTGRWIILVSFTASGQQTWTDLTRDLAPNQGQVAIVVDGTVVSAPTIQGVITGDAQIAGSFTRADAESLAAQLNGGALPLRLTVEEIAQVN